MAMSGLNKVTIGEVPEFTIRGDRSLPDWVVKQRIEAAQTGKTTLEKGLISTSMERASDGYFPSTADNNRIATFFENLIGKNITPLSQHGNKEKEWLINAGQVQWTEHLDKDGNHIFVAKPVWSPAGLKVDSSPVLEAVYGSNHVFKVLSELKGGAASGALGDLLERLLIEPENIDISTLNALENELSDFFSDLKNGLDIHDPKTIEVLMSIIVNPRTSIIREKLQQAAANSDESQEIMRINSAIKVMDITLNEIGKLKEMVADNEPELLRPAIRNALSSINATVPGLIKGEVPSQEPVITKPEVQRRARPIMLTPQKTEQIQKGEQPHQEQRSAKPTLQHDTPAEKKTLVENKEVTSFIRKGVDPTLHESAHFPKIQKNWPIDNDYKTLLAIRRDFAALDANLSHLYAEINMMREYLEGAVQRIAIGDQHFADPYEDASAEDQSRFMSVAEKLMKQYKQTMEQTLAELQGVIKTSDKVSVQNKKRRDDCIKTFTEKVNKTASSLAKSLDKLKGLTKIEGKAEVKGPSRGQPGFDPN